MSLYFRKHSYGVFSLAFTQSGHEITLVKHRNGQLFTYYRNNCLFVHMQYDNHLISLSCQSWTAVLWSKLRNRNGQHYSGILKVSSIARWNGRQGIIFLIALKSIQHKLSSDYSLYIYMYSSRAVFPILMVHHFLRTNPNKMSVFQRSVTCSFFLELYSNIDKNSGEKVWGCFSSK